MKRIKVSEATPIQLDWLVAKCNGDFTLYHDIEQGQRFLNLWVDSAFLKYSTLWSCGGQIIEREEIGFAKYGPNGSWKAVIGETPRGSPFYGPTPLIAVCRCYVASKMGEMVEVPEELT